MAEQVFDAPAIAAHLARELPEWSYIDGTIRRLWRTKGWQATLILATTIGYFAEAAGHHPDLLLSWDKLEVRLSTHSANGITKKDFALAAKLEEVLT